MYMRVILLMLVFAMVASARAALVACPDCGVRVSARAVWCPACGCPGEAIAESAKATLEAAKPKPPAEVLVGVSDRGSFPVWPVQLEGRHLLVADLADVEGVNTLLITNAVHSVTVDYRRPAVAENLPIAAFETPPATNILFRVDGVRVPSRWEGAERQVDVSAETRFIPISPKALRRQGRAWRAGDRDPASYEHPFYRNRLKSAEEESTHD